MNGKGQMVGTAAKCSFGSLSSLEDLTFRVEACTVCNNFSLYFSLIMLRLHFLASCSRTVRLGFKRMLVEQSFINSFKNEFKCSLGANKRTQKKSSFFFTGISLMGIFLPALIWINGASCFPHLLHQQSNAIQEDMHVSSHIDVQLLETYALLADALC